MGSNDRLANGEADAYPGILGAEEPVEDMLQVRRGNSRPVVEDGKDNGGFFIDRGLDIDTTCRLSRLHERLNAVDEQIDDHLLQLDPIAHYAGEPSSQCRRQGNRLRINVVSD